MQAREPVGIHGEIGLAKFAGRGKDLAAQDIDDVLDLLWRCKHKRAAAVVDEPDRIPTQVARVIVGGVSALMFNEASNGRAADLPKLLPEMMYLAVTPYFGHERGMVAMKETEIPV